MIEPLDIEVFDDKKVILHDIVDYDNNIANNIISENKKHKKKKINKEINDIIRENKLTFSTDTMSNNNKLKNET